MAKSIIMQCINAKGPPAVNRFSSVFVCVFFLHRCVYLLFVARLEGVRECRMDYDKRTTQIDLGAFLYVYFCLIHSSLIRYSLKYHAKYHVYDNWFNFTRTMKSVFHEHSRFLGKVVERHATRAN